MPIIPRYPIPEVNLGHAPKYATPSASDFDISGAFKAVSQLAESGVDMLAKYKQQRDELEATTLFTAAAMDSERYAIGLKAAPPQRQKISTTMPYEVAPGEEGTEVQLVQETEIPKSQTYIPDLTTGLKAIHEKYNKAASNDNVRKMFNTKMAGLNRTIAKDGWNYTINQRNAETNAAVGRSLARIEQDISTLPPDAFDAAKRRVDTAMYVIEQGARAGAYGGDPSKEQQVKKQVTEALYKNYGVQWATTDPTTFMVLDTQNQNPLKDALSATDYNELRGKAISTWKSLQEMSEKSRKLKSEDLQKLLIADAYSGVDISGQIYNQDGTLTGVGRTLTGDDLRETLAVNKSLRSTEHTRGRESDPSDYNPIMAKVYSAEIDSHADLERVMRGKQISMEHRKGLHDEIESRKTRLKDEGMKYRDRTVSANAQALDHILNPQNQIGLNMVYREALKVIAANAVREYVTRAWSNEERMTDPGVLFNEVMGKWAADAIAQTTLLKQTRLQAPIYRSMTEVEAAAKQGKFRSEAEYAQAKSEATYFSILGTYLKPVTGGAGGQKTPTTGQPSGAPSKPGKPAYNPPENQ